MFVNEQTARAYGFESAQDFNEALVESLGIEIDPRVSLEPSPNGGYGLFFSNAVSSQNETKIALIRVPRDSTINLESFKKTLSREKSRYTELAESPQQPEIPVISPSEFMSAFLMSNPKVSESNILQSILLGLEFYKQYRENLAAFCDDSADSPSAEPLKSFVGASEFSKWDHYVTLLLNVFADTVDYYSWTDLQQLGEYAQTKPLLAQCIESVVYNQTVLADALAAFPEAVVPEDCPVRFYTCQTAAVIKSRTLELPRPSDEADKYVCDMALVPIVDFANHSNSMSNAYYDVDPHTGDAVLYLDAAALPDQSTFEILISYHESDSVLEFLCQYGFIPLSSGVRGSDTNTWDLGRPFAGMETSLEVQFSVHSDELEITGISLSDSDPREDTSDTSFFQSAARFKDYMVQTYLPHRLDYVSSLSRSLPLEDSVYSGLHKSQAHKCSSLYSYLLYECRIIRQLQQTLVAASPGQLGELMQKPL